MSATDKAGKFDTSRANEYAEQARIALAGYDACHELAACLLSARLGRGRQAQILAVGAGGTAQEILVPARLESNWSFTAVDPSPPMLSAAQAAVVAAGLSERTAWRLGTVADLPDCAPFDAATLIGVLHHVGGRDEKLALLTSIAVRLGPQAPLIIACNRGAYADNQLFLDAWAARWRMAGAADEEVEAKLARIKQGADPPSSDAEIGELLGLAGFDAPQLFFSSLFWGAWIACRARH